MCITSVRNGKKKAKEKVIKKKRSGRRLSTLLVQWAFQEKKNKDKWQMNSFMVAHQIGSKAIRHRYSRGQELTLGTSLKRKTSC